MVEEHSIPKGIRYAIGIFGIFNDLEVIFDIAKGRGQRAEGRREKIDCSRFQYLALS
jgi:hypothetical protein